MNSDLRGSLRIDSTSSLHPSCYVALHLLPISFRVIDLKVWYEPTDVVGAGKAFLGRSAYPDFISPNYNELLEILKVIKPSLNIPSLGRDWASQVEILSDVVDNVIVTLGRDGVLISRAGSKTQSFFEPSHSKRAKYLKHSGSVTQRIYAPDEVLAGDQVVSSSGAGDCFASGFISAMLSGEDEESCVRKGFKCSLASLRSHATVPETF